VALPKFDPGADSRLVCARRSNRVRGIPSIIGYHVLVTRERRDDPHAPRRRFSTLAREAIETTVPETGDRRAHWHVGINGVAVCWPARDGWRHVALRRESERLSGDYGCSDTCADLEELARLPGEIHGTPIGVRVGLDQMLDSPPLPWRARSETQLRERLEWIVTRLVSLGPAWLERHEARS
jgi:hypothetical protein